MNNDYNLEERIAMDKFYTNIDIAYGLIKDYIKEINHITFACKTEKFTLVFKKEMFIDAKHIKQTKIVFIDLL